LPDLLRQRGIAQNTDYRWKRKYRGPEPSQLRRLKDLERENGQL
jgi:putative transposase